jgi:hypothetical protein
MTPFMVSVMSLLDGAPPPAPGTEPCAVRSSADKDQT